VRKRLCLYAVHQLIDAQLTHSIYLLLITAFLYNSGVAEAGAGAETDRNSSTLHMRSGDVVEVKPTHGDAGVIK
jgi:hypothetical protein